MEEAISYVGHKFWLPIASRPSMANTRRLIWLHALLALSALQPS
jgi:hypothetical protein